MPKHGGSPEMKMPEGQEEILGLHIEQIHDRSELKEIRQELANEMKYDAKNDTYQLTGSSSERREAIKSDERSITHNKMSAGKDDLILLAKVADKTVGYLVVDMTEAGKKAEVHELRTKFNKRSEHRIISTLLEDAKRRLKERQYNTLEIPTDSPGVPLDAALRYNNKLQYGVRVVSKEGEHALPPANDNLEDLENAA